MSQSAPSCDSRLPAVAAILAAGYLRLLQAKSVNSQEQAKLRAPDSVESPCYHRSPEA